MGTSPPPCPSPVALALTPPALARARLKLEQAQRRIDQAIGEELRAASASGEVNADTPHPPPPPLPRTAADCAACERLRVPAQRASESGDKLKRLKVERDLIAAKLQRQEMSATSGARPSFCSAHCLSLVVVRR